MRQISLAAQNVPESLMKSFRKQSIPSASDTKEVLDVVGITECQSQFVNTAPASQPDEDESPGVKLEDSHISLSRCSLVLRLDCVAFLFLLHPARAVFT